MYQPDPDRDLTIPPADLAEPTEVEAMYANMSETEADLFDVNLYAKRATKEAIDAILQIARESESDRVRLEAYCIILERGAGKPTEHKRIDKRVTHQQVVMLRHGTGDALPELPAGRN